MSTPKLSSALKHLLSVLMLAALSVQPAVADITAVYYDARDYVLYGTDGIYATGDLQITYPVTNPYHVSYSISAFADAAPPPSEPPYYAPTGALAYVPYFNYGPGAMGVTVEGPGFVIASGWSSVSVLATDSASAYAYAGGNAYLVDTPWGGSSASGAGVTASGSSSDSKSFTTEAFRIDAGQVKGFTFTYQPGAGAQATANGSYNVPNAHATASASAGWSLSFYRASPNPGSLIVPPAYLNGSDMPAATAANPVRWVEIDHGMGDNSDNPWVSNFVALEIADSSRPEATVVKRDWRVGAGLFNDNNLVGALDVPAGIGRVYGNAQLEGIAKAKEWISAIDSGLVQPNQIEFIGHSFGGVVDAVAANLIYQHYKNDPRFNTDDRARIGRLVILDTPDLSFLRATGNVNPDSVLQISNLYGSLIDGAFGGPIDGPNVVNVKVDFADRHLPLTTLGHNALVDSGSTDPSVWAQVRDQVLNLAPGNYVENFSSGTSQFVSQAPTQQQFPDYVMIPVNAAFERLQDWSGFNTSLVQQNDGDDGLAVKMEEHSPAQIYSQLTIPQGADYMRFKLLAQAVGAGDELLVSFGNTLLYDQPLVGTQADFSLTEPIFVGDLAGLTDQFVVTLQSDGYPGTTVYLSDLEFLNASAVPEPPSACTALTGLVILAFFINCHRTKKARGSFP